MVISKRLGRVVLLLLLVFFSTLQQVSTPVFNCKSADSYSYHNPNANTKPCHLIDCISSVAHCCSNVMCDTPQLAIFEQISTPINLLGYFFSSIEITPKTPPPKITGC